LHVMALARLQVRRAGGAASSHGGRRRSRRPSRVSCSGSCILQSLLICSCRGMSLSYGKPVDIYSLGVIL
jgi:hypothetical protein